MVGQCVMAEIDTILQNIYDNIKRVFYHFKSLGFLDSYVFHINTIPVTGRDEHFVTSLLDFQLSLSQFLTKLENESKHLTNKSIKHAEIRNIITRLVKHKSKCSDLKAKDNSTPCCLEEETVNSSEKIESDNSVEKNLDDFLTSDVQDTYVYSDCGSSITQEELKNTEPTLHTPTHNVARFDITSSLGNEHLFDCDICREKFTTKKLLEFHIITTHVTLTEEANNTNTQTSKKFEKCNSENLEHKTLFMCVICDRNYEYQRSLNTHIKLKHSGEVHGFSCKVCCRRFNEKKNLTRHEQSHITQQFQCATCFKNFGRNDSLQRHVNTIHLQAEDFSCRMCGKLFSLKFNRDTHESTYHIDKSFCVQCDKCGKTFKNKLTLKAHSRVHSQNRLTCNLCKKLFVRKASYKNHMKKKHPGYSPYQSLVDSVLKDDIL